MTYEHIPEGTLVRALNEVRVCYPNRSDDVVNVGTYGTIVYYPDYSAVTDEPWYGVRWYREAGITGIEVGAHEIELVDVTASVTHYGCAARI